MVAGGKLSRQHAPGQPVFQVPLDGTPQGPRAVGNIETFLRQPVARRRRQRAGNFPFRQAFLHFAYHQRYNFPDLRPAQRMENDGFVNPVQQFRAEGPPQGILHRPRQLRRNRPRRRVLRPAGRRVEPEGALGQVARAQVAGHYDHRVAEIHRPPLPVGQPPVLQDLQQQVEHIRVRLFDFVKEDDPVRAAAHGLGQLPGVIVAHIARRGADEAGHGVPFPVLGHIQAHHAVGIVKEELGQGLAQLRLADPGGAQKDEAAEGAARVVEAGARAPDGVRNRLHGRFLPDDPAVQFLLHTQQPFRFSGQEAPGGDARPAGNQLGDVLLGYPQLAAVGRRGDRHFPFRVQAGFQLQAFRAVLRRLLEVGHLVGAFLQVGQFPAAAFHLLHLRGQGAGVNPHLAGGFVNKVNGLVGQAAVGYIAAAQPHGRGQGCVADADLVVGFVAGLQGPEDVQRGLGRRFGDIDGVEPPGQGRIPLNMLAVFVQGGGADGLQFAPGQGGLEHIAGVQAAFAGAGAHHSMHFVQKDDDFAAGRLYFVDHRLQAFLKLAAELGAGHQAAHIQGHHPLVVQGIGHIVAHDFAGQAFGDGRLADARFADEDGVVLGAAGQGLHYLADFAIPAHYRIQFALPRQFGQVDAVLFQGAVALFGVPVVHPVGAAHLHHRPIDHFLVDAQLAEQARRIAGILPHCRQQQVFHADELVLQPAGFLLGHLQHPLQAGGDENLRRVRSRHQFGAGFQGLVQPRLDRFGVHAQFPEDAFRQPFLQRRQRQQDVFHIPLAVAVALHQFLGPLQRILRLPGEIVRAHYHNSIPPCQNLRAFPCRAWCRRPGPFSGIPAGAGCAGLRPGPAPAVRSEPQPGFPVPGCGQSVSGQFRRRPG